MDMENKNFLMEIIMKGTIKMENLREKVYIDGKMVQFMMANF